MTAGLARPGRSRRRALGWVLAWSAVEALPALGGGLILAAAVDSGFLAGRPVFGLGLLVLLGISQLISALATRAVFPWLADLVEPLRDDRLAGVVGATIRAAVAGQPVDLTAVARLTTQVETVRNLVSALLRVLRQGAVSLLAALVGLALIDPSLAVPVAGCVALATVVFLVVVQRLRARQRDALAAGETLADEAARVFLGLREVMAAGAEERAGADLDRAVAAQRVATLRTSYAMAGRTLAVVLGGYLPLFWLLVAMPAQVARGSLTIGGAVGAAVYLVTRLLPAVSALTATVGTWLAQLSVVEHRLREAAQAANESVADAGSGRPGAGPHPAVPPGLGLRGVTFRFGPHAAPIVDGLDLDVPAGGHLVIVGPSGAGKSTLVQLLTGELPTERGAVLLGGVPVRRIPPDTMHRTVAVVPQEAYVFSGTLRENLTYLRPDAGDEDLDLAAAATGLDAVRDELGGYDATLDARGDALPAGTRQLVALTRAYLSPASVVILDEAACHLDLGVEARVEEAFRRRGGLLVVVAHRLESARRADQVLVLDGPVPRVGSPADVLPASSVLAPDIASNSVHIP